MIVNDTRNGLLPSKPLKTREGVFMPEPLWELLQECWAENALERPSADTIASRLKEIARTPPWSDRAVLPRKFRKVVTSIKSALSLKK